MKAILRAGVDGLAHPSWRAVRRSTKSCSRLLKERPGLFVVLTLWGSRNQIFGRRPAWIDDPLLRETFTDAEIAALENRTVAEDAPAKWKAGDRAAGRREAEGGRCALRAR